jgi:subtilisin family serine protease
MVEIDTKRGKFFIKFKKKEERPNQRDDKFELFRNIAGLNDHLDLLDLMRYSGSHMTDPIEKHMETVTDINNHEVPVIIARLTPEQAAALRRNPNIEYVAADGLAYAAQSQPGPVQGRQTIPWGYTKLKTSQAWQVTAKKGDGVNVAVIDTGCDHNHPDLTPAVTINQNFTVEPGTIMRDSDHHGCHVMGTIVMQNNSQGFVGIAPNAKGWNLKAGYSRATPPENAPGAFDWTDWLEALEYAKTNNAPIVNNSIAALNVNPTNPGPDTIAASVKDGFDNKGIIYMAALGNEGVANANSFMSNTYGAFGISNLHHPAGDNLHPTSNHGINVDFVFPGGDIWSTIGGGNYFAHSGTSMATPHASGVAALALSVFNDKGCPPYSAGLKKNKVVGGAFRLAVNKLNKFTTERDNRYGYGLPEADKVCRAMMGMALT